LAFGAGLSINAIKTSKSNKNYQSIYVGLTLSAMDPIDVTGKQNIGVRNKNASRESSNPIPLSALGT
jgi:hypothetical protein